MKKSEIFIQKPQLNNPKPPPIPCVHPLSETIIAKHKPESRNKKRCKLSMKFVSIDEIEHPPTVPYSLPCIAPNTEELDRSVNDDPKEQSSDIKSLEEYSKSSILILIIMYLKMKKLKHTKASLIKEANLTDVKVEKEPLKTSELYDLLKRKIQQLAPPKKGKNVKSWMTYNDIPEIEEEEESIWVELGRLSSKGLSYDPQTKELRAATINRLIERLTDNEKYSKDFMKAFLMTHKSFTNSRTLFRKLCERYKVPSNERVTKAYVKEWEESRTLIKLRVCNVIKNWIESHFSDFTKDMIEKLFIFIDNEVATSSGLESAKQLKQSLLSKINGEDMNKKKVLPIKKDNNRSGASLKDLDPRDVARQLTLIDYQLYSQIKHDELLDAKWSVAKTKHEAPHLNTFVERFNHMSYWIQSMIVRTTNLQDRIKLLCNLLRVEEHLRTLRNYNALMAINSALNMANINRLSLTWTPVPPDLIQVHRECTAFLGNQNDYKDHIHHINLPMIPFIGPFQTDLVYIEDGNPNEIEGLTNITKRILAYRTISLVLRGQAVAYELEKMPRLYTYLYLLSEELSEQDIEKIAKQRYDEEQRMSINS